jgi:hypothetical protein
VCHSSFVFQHRLEVVVVIVPTTPATATTTAAKTKATAKAATAVAVIVAIIVAVIPAAAAPIVSVSITIVRSKIIEAVVHGAIAHSAAVVAGRKPATTATATVTTTQTPATSSKAATTTPSNSNGAVVDKSRGCASKRACGAKWGSCRHRHCRRRVAVGTSRTAFTSSTPTPAVVCIARLPLLRTKGPLTAAAPFATILLFFVLTAVLFTFCQLFLVLVMILVLMLLIVIVVVVAEGGEGCMAKQLHVCHQPTPAVGEKTQQRQAHTTVHRS